MKELNDRYNFNNKVAGDKGSLPDEFITKGQIRVDNKDTFTEGLELWTVGNDGIVFHNGMYEVYNKRYANDLILNFSQGNLLKRYIYVFQYPILEWNVVHNIGKIPDVQTTDLQNNSFYGAIQHISINELTIKYSKPIAGILYLYA